MQFVGRPDLFQTHPYVRVIAEAINVAQRFSVSHFQLDTGEILILNECLPDRDTRLSECPLIRGNKICAVLPELDKYQQKTDEHTDVSGHGQIAQKLVYCHGSS